MRNKNGRTAGLWIAPLLAAGLLVGCQETREVEVEPRPTVPGAQVEVERPTGEKLDDAAITTQVKSALTASPQVGALGVDVDTVANVVTLSGTVNSVEQKRVAEEIAKDVEGVTSVVNNLTVEAEAEAG